MAKLGLRHSNGKISGFGATPPLRGGSTEQDEQTVEIDFAPSHSNYKSDLNQRFFLGCGIYIAAFTGFYILMRMGPPFIDKILNKDRGIQEGKIPDEFLISNDFFISNEILSKLEEINRKFEKINERLDKIEKKFEKKSN